MTTINNAKDLAAALDYLPVAVRAADRNPDSDILWTEAYRAQCAVIECADAHLPEPLAADVQVTVGRIARQASLSAIGGCINAAILTERAKARIRTLLADNR